MSGNINLLVITYEMLTSQVPGLYIAESSISGRGVFTTNDIPKGSMIEICPVIVLNKEDTQTIHNTRLHDYYFIWNLEEGTSVMVLGYGSIYNHSTSPNAEFETRHTDKEMVFRALKDIAAGEEITTDYIGPKEAGNKLWFKIE